MSFIRRWTCVLFLPLLGCGGGSSGSNGSPSGPSVPTPSGHSVLVTVFYDENGNGQIDGDEGVRVPGVEVVIGTGSGVTNAGSGQAAVTGILEGTHNVTLRPETLPAYYQAAAAFSIQVPATAQAVYPVALPIGNNNTNLYLGFGDSLTAGTGSADGRGYGLKLENALGPHLGRAEVRLSGRSGDMSVEGTEVIRKDMRNNRPAYNLILLGTNDWHNQACQDVPPADCFTIDALREIIRVTRDWNGLPVLGTLPPVNPALAPAGRNDWIDELNVLIRGLAAEQQALLADINAEFKARGDLASLFSDDVHPNDAGYDAMADAWFRAITQPRSASAAAGFGFGFAASH